MSPLQHKDDDSDGRRHGRLPSLYDLVPYIQQMASDIAATPLEQFAAQLMTRTVGQILGQVYARHA